MEIDKDQDPMRIELGQFYPHAPRQVWQAFTDSTVIQQWFLQSVGYVVEVGAQFMFLIPSDPPAEIACTVVEAQPSARLAWSWRDTRSSVATDWPVLWSMHAHGRGTHLILSQQGFDPDDRRQQMARNAMERFWRTPFAQLGPVLDTL